MGEIEDLWRGKYYDKTDELSRTERALDIAVNELESIDHYLDKGNGTNIPSGSVGHRAVKESLEWIGRILKGE